jgi:uridine kinase
VNRKELLSAVSRRVAAVAREHTVRVAIDGVDAAGKTTIADELASCIRGAGRPVIRASIDGFHNPRSLRYQRGRLSPEGFYLDSFNLSAIVDVLLVPLGPGGSGNYRAKVFDHLSDAAVSSPLMKAERGAILLFDGVFLLRNELRSYWDFTIFVKANFQVTLARACSRDSRVFGSDEEVERRYNARYIPGQRMYLDQCIPENRADFVIDNNDITHPILIAGATK